MREQEPRSSVMQQLRNTKSAFAKKFPQAAEWLRSAIPYTLSRLPMGINIILRGLVVRELSKSTVAANTLSTSLQYFVVGPTTAILFATGMKMRKYLQREDPVGVHLVFDNGLKVAALLTLIEGFLLLTLRYSLPVVGIPRDVAKETADYFESFVPVLLPMYWLVNYQQLALATNRASVTQYSGWAYLASSMALGYPLAFVMGIRGIAVGYYTGPLTLVALERYYLRTPAFRQYLSLAAAREATVEADSTALTNYNDTSMGALTKFGIGLSSQVWTDWLRAVLVNVTMANIDNSNSLRALHSGGLVNAAVLTVIAAPAQVTRVGGTGRNVAVVEGFKKVLRQIKQGTATPDLVELHRLLAQEEQFSVTGIRIATGSITLFAALMAGLHKQISSFGLDDADKADPVVVSLADDMYLTSLAMLCVDGWRYMLSAAHNSTGRLYHPAVVSFIWMNVAGFALGVLLAVLEHQQRSNWLLIAGTGTITGAAIHLRYTWQRYIREAKQDVLQLVNMVQVQPKQPRFIEAATEVAREETAIETAVGHEHTSVVPWRGQPHHISRYVLFAMVVGLISEGISSAAAHDSPWQDLSYALKWMVLAFTTLTFVMAHKMRLTFFSSSVNRTPATTSTLQTRLIEPDEVQRQDIGVTSRVVS